jgi:hypoxanthine-guanine phosphoribosyltransferase
MALEIALIENMDDQQPPITSTPYVLSADLAGLFTGWGREARILVPPREYFHDVHCQIGQSLEKVFGDIHIVEEETIRKSFQKAYVETTKPVVSIDRVYMSHVVGNDFSGYLDITRAVNEKFEAKGLIARFKSGDMGIESFQAAVDRLPSSYVGKEVVLVDDVVFSGRTISQIVSALNTRGMSVKNVIAGVSIGEAKKTLATNNIELQSSHHFESVVDEVCCRDFIVGAPYGGRTVVVESNHMEEAHLEHAPYLLPFGEPEKWATIPAEKVLSFSMDMLRMSHDIWLNIQKLNGRKFSTRELGCRVYGLPDRNSVVDAIEKVQESLRPCL